MLLINPKFEKGGKCTYFSKWVPVTFPVGIASLALYLLNRKKQAKIIDENIEPITADNIQQIVEGLSKPYIFGISCVTANIMRAYELAKLIEETYPDAFVILGGIHPTVLPEEALNTGNVDIVVRREGEETLNQLYERIKAGKDYFDVDGISYKQKDGQIKHNKNAKLIEDLNELAPFPYYLFEKHIQHYGLGFIMASRGCPYECIFCSARCISGKKYRCVKPEKVIEQLDILINKYKLSYVYFIDDNLVVNKSWTKQLCDMMYEKGYYKHVKFSCSLRSDGVDDEILEYLKKAGFVLLNMGIESVSNRLLKLIKKGETIEQHTKAAMLIRKHGMRVGGTFILGLPTETKEERQANYKWAKKYMDLARFNNPAPYPGTELYEIAKKEGRLNLGEHYENLNPVAALVENPTLPYVPTTCTEEELRRDVIRFNYGFMLRPTKIWLLLFEGSPLWFSLPPKWYLHPTQWKDIFVLGCKISSNLAKKGSKVIARKIKGKK